MAKKKKPTSKLKYKLSKKILDVFKQFPEKTLNYKQLATLLNISDSSERKLIHEVLQELEEHDLLSNTQRGIYRLNANSTEVTGVIDFNQRGAGYLIVEGQEDDIFVHGSKAGKAFHKDTVKCRLFKKAGKVEGEVIEIIERNKVEFIGTVDIGKNTIFVRPEESRMPVDFFIDRGHLKGAKHGEKVKIKFLTWPTGNKSPYGAVVERLGMPGTMDVDMNVILAESGFPIKFPVNVEKDAENIKEPDYDQLTKDRRDFRDTLTFTIDPHDAKDFDDALSYKELKNGNYEIGIHIADVSHYVQPKTDLDTEAFNRGNSVYLVDRVIPMLPEVLSNKLCSLRPHETKLTFSAVFEMDKNGKVLSEWFGKTMIYSDHRFTYEEAQEIIEGNVKDPKFGDIILNMDRIAKILRGHRLESGALNVDSQEVRFNLDEKGNPIGLIIKVSKDANKLIEEYMLLANRRVAAFVGKPETGKKTAPFVYRIHDEPNDEKLSDLRIFLAEFGYSIKEYKNKPIAYSLNEVMEKAKEKDELNIIGPMVIRSMSKAVYSTDNHGHYGLAFDYYGHFTSPIRRYADLLVHRILFAKLHNQRFEDAASLEAWCKHISGTEKAAVEAERASTKYMQVKFMADKIGLTFEGKVTGVMEFGIFVEMIENKCEGLIHISKLPRGYKFDAKTKQLVSNSNDEKYHLGKNINVVVKHVDVIKKQIDLEFAEEVF